MVCDTFDRSEFGIKLAQATELRGDLQVRRKLEIEYANDLANFGREKKL